MLYKIGEGMSDREYVTEMVMSYLKNGNKRAVLMQILFNFAQISKMGRISTSYTMTMHCMR